MTKAERAIKALRECADALDNLPFRRTSMLGGFMVNTDILRGEANWIENQIAMWSKSNEED